MVIHLQSRDYTTLAACDRLLRITAVQHPKVYEIRTLVYCISLFSTHSTIFVGDAWIDILTTRILCSQLGEGDSGGSYVGN